MAENEKKDAGKLLTEYEEAVERSGGREAMVDRFGDVTVKLRHPVEHEGNVIQELRLNFNALTGLDMEVIDEQIGALGLRGMLPAYSRRYQRMLAARAADVPDKLLLSLSLADYNAVVGAAQNFLLVTG